MFWVYLNQLVLPSPVVPNMTIWLTSEATTREEMQLQLIIFALSECSEPNHIQYYWQLQIQRQRAATTSCIVLQLWLKHASKKAINSKAVGALDTDRKCKEDTRSISGKWTATFRFTIISRGQMMQYNEEKESSAKVIHNVQQDFTLQLPWDPGGIHVTCSG